MTLVGAHDRSGVGDLSAQLVDARHLGEISLITLVLADAPCTPMMLTLSGAQRLDLAVGSTVEVRLNLDLVHVMPRRAR